MAGQQTSAEITVTIATIITNETRSKVDGQHHLSHEDLGSLNEDWGVRDIKPLLQTFQTQLLHLLIAALHLHGMEGQHGDLLHVLRTEEVPFTSSLQRAAKELQGTTDFHDGSSSSTCCVGNSTDTFMSLPVPLSPWCPHWWCSCSCPPALWKTVLGPQRSLGWSVPSALPGWSRCRAGCWPSAASRPLGPPELQEGWKRISTSPITVQAHKHHNIFWKITTVMMFDMVLMGASLTVILHHFNTTCSNLPVKLCEPQLITKNTLVTYVKEGNSFHLLSCCWCAPLMWWSGPYRCGWRPPEKSELLHTSAAAPGTESGTGPAPACRPHHWSGHKHTQTQTFEALEQVPVWWSWWSPTSIQLLCLSESFPFSLGEMSSLSSERRFSITRLDRIWTYT